MIEYNPLLLEIADYVDGYAVAREAAYETALYCLLDSLSCALEALDHPGNRRGPY